MIMAIINPAMNAPLSPAPQSRLDFIRPRETSRIQKARSGRKTFIIKKLRVWLPATAAIVVFLLVLWPHLMPNFAFKDISKNVPDLVIDNLNYSGQDEKNQAYSVRAAQATKPSALHGIYDMVKPEGEITLQNGVWLDGKADYGRYDSVGKKLWLGGNVQLFQDKGYQVTTDDAQVDLDSNDAWGDKNVLIQGPFGTVRGAGFRFLESGHTIVINGPATAVLNLHGEAVSGTSLSPAPVSP